MADRKNIFRIGRQGHRGDENQLTEMLAYLFQQERQLVPQCLDGLGIECDVGDGWEVETQRSVPGGFLDLVLFVPGKTLVIVESKLGSTTDFQQISKYISYAKSFPASTWKALLFMPQHREPWPARIEDQASDDVALVLRRWQALGDVLRNTDSVLGNDFVNMLEHEGLVTPKPLTSNDWQTWSAGNRVSRHLATLLDETGEALGKCEPSLKKIYAVTFSNTGAIHRGLDFEGLSLYVGFWPTRKPTGRDDSALVSVYVLNKRLPLADRKAEGQAAVEKAASPHVAMSGWSEYHVGRTAPAPLVLDASDFKAQCNQLVDHVIDALAFFRDLGYLDHIPGSHVG